MSAINDSFLFSQLKENEFQDVLSRSKLNFDKQDTKKLQHLIFNPFSTNNRGETFLTLNSGLDPDYNYYNHLVNHVDECNYHQKDSSSKLVKGLDTMNFSMLHLNIRSIVNKYEDLQAYITYLQYTFSVIGLTETWLNTENNNKYQIPQYKYIGKMRENKQGGGVGLYVNKAYHFKERDDLAINFDDVIESQFIEITAKPNNIIVGIIYRPQMTLNSKKVLQDYY